MRILIALALVAAAVAQDAPKVHFHHIHLNATDPAAAIKFYTNKFACEKAAYHGAPAVWTQKSWILFSQVKDAPPAETVSAIWHFGWGAEDMPAAYQKQLDSGTKFQTPLTDISGLVGKPPGNFFFAYVDGPDHALIEMNTAPHHRFGHIHLLSDDPVAAAEWYKKYFGIVGMVNKESRVFKGVHVAPMASLQLDNVNIIIFPIEYARDAMTEWKDRTTFEPTDGRVVDHIAFSVDSLPDTLARLKKDGIKYAKVANGFSPRPAVSAYITGPDKIKIELIEGQAAKE